MLPSEAAERLKLHRLSDVHIVVGLTSEGVEEAGGILGTDGLVQRAGSGLGGATKLKIGVLEASGGGHGSGHRYRAEGQLASLELIAGSKHGVELSTCNITLSHGVECIAVAGDVDSMVHID